MMVLTVIVVALIAFFIGFLVGVKEEPIIKAVAKHTKPDEDLKNLIKEYQNFLYYDGSEQQ